ncbi:MAG: molecular chaperone HtpG [Coriobacteriia bacterium]|nr:molecular chaperone HtpG [Coriobacteriia bacterium]
MRKFKTESQKLLDLMINSIYTNKEIFLRELISNASDAIDKLNFRSLTDSDVKLAKDDLAINLAFDRNKRTITVSDNGIGMTEAELDKNLGTIAHSDSQTFKDENAEQQGEDVDIIGQFGVGFYSSFMVASKVRVVSKAYGAEQAFAWESDGVKGYTVEPAERESCGTDVILTIKPTSADEDYDLFLTEYRLKELVKRYSNYVRYPIKMEVTHSRQKPKPEDAGDDYKPEYENITEVETLNSMVPIWKRKRSEVEDEEYNQFYQSQFHDTNPPARIISFHAEGSLNYDVLLFIPQQAPSNLYTRGFEKGLALYSSNVMIQEKCSDLLPDHFNFVRGVVDSQDLHLNISRETLQQNAQLRAIAKRVEKKIKSELMDMLKEDREAYEKFFKQFGDMMKYGVYTTYGEASAVLLDLLLFYSAKQEKLVTLDEFVAGMPEEQDKIYFAVGTSLDLLTRQPAVTSVLNKGFDALLCTGPVDEVCLTILHEFNDTQIQNCGLSGTDLATEDEKKDAESVEEDNKDLLDAVKEALGAEVTKVVVSTRLTSEDDAAACVVPDGMVSFAMERVMAASGEDEDYQPSRILELNAKHPVFAAIQSASDLGQAEKVADYATLLYGQALLVEGLPLKDPLAFATLVSKLMV